MQIRCHMWFECQLFCFMLYPLVYNEHLRFQGPTLIESSNQTDYKSGKHLQVTMYNTLSVHPASTAGRGVARLTAKYATSPTSTLDPSAVQTKCSRVVA